jgi:hypothetical protein
MLCCYDALVSLFQAYAGTLVRVDDQMGFQIGLITLYLSHDLEGHSHVNL